MRNAVCALLLGALLLGPSAPEQAEGPAIHARRAVVMHSGGELVYEKGARERSLIASTTKLMTALIAVESAAPEALFTADAACCAVEGSSMYLREGESYSVRELLQGLLLASGNDAALLLAKGIAGSESAFVERMNRRAAELGLQDTHYANPHGLDDEAHYSTARDLALLMRACVQNRALCSILSEKSAVVGQQTFYNHNRLLTLCPGCIGGKTGYTEAAGRCLVSCCEREGTRLICVTLHDPDDWVDHQVLYNWAFSRYSTRNVTEKLHFTVPVVSGTENFVKVAARELRVFLPRAEELTAVAYLPSFVFAPVESGEKAGSVRIFRSGELLRETELYYTSDVAQTGRTL